MASSDDGSIEIPVNVDVTGAEAIDALRDKVEKLNDKLGELTKGMAEGAGAAANAAVNVFRLGTAYDAAATNLSRFLSTLGSQTGMLAQSVTQLAAVRSQLEGIAKATPAATKAVDGAKAKAAPTPQTPMQSKINQSLGIGAPVKSAEASASVFEHDFAAKAAQGGQAVEEAAAKVEKLEAAAGKSKGVVSALAGNLLALVPQNLTTSLSAVTGESSLLTEGMEALTGAIGVELSPVLAVAAAATAAFYGAFGLLHADLQKGIPADLTTGLNLTADQLARVKDRTVTMGDTMQATFEVIAGDLQKQFGGALQQVEQIMVSVGNAIVGGIENAVVGYVAYLAEVFTLVTDVWKKFPLIMQEIGEAAHNLFGQAMNGLENMAIDLINYLIRAADLTLNIKIPTLNHEVFTPLKSEATGTMASIGADVMATGARVTDGIHAMIANLLSQIKDQSIRDALIRIDKQAGEVEARHSAPRGTGSNIAQSGANSGAGTMGIRPDVDDDFTPIAPIALAPPEPELVLTPALDGLAKLTTATQKATGDQTRAFSTMYQSVGDGMRKTVEGLIEGTTSFQQVWINAQRKMLDFALKTIENTVLAHITGNAQKVDSDKAAANQAGQVSFKATLAQIQNDAAKTYSGVAAATAPYLGPFAPVAGAAAYATIIALEGAAAVFSARDGAAAVPYDNAPFLLHKNEMVLPEKYASPLRDMLGRNGAGTAVTNRSINRRGDDHYHIYTQPGMSPRDVADAILKGRRGNMYDARRFA